MAVEIPRYAAVPLQRFLESWERDIQLLHLSTQGIRVLTSMPQLVEALMLDAELEKQLTLKPKLAAATENAQLAENEQKAGFPLLHAHVLVGIWGSLEAAIEDMLVGILLNEPDILRKDTFAKIKVSLADFESRDKEERMRFLISEIDRTLARKNGIDAFEGLLQHFDLSGEVDDEVRKLIWQMHHIRNVIVHRASRADRRLVEACPWLSLKVNDIVVVSDSMLRELAMATAKYGLTVIHRLGKRYDVDTHGLIRNARSDPVEQKGPISVPESLEN
jgi:hypothetical protein